MKSTTTSDDRLDRTHWEGLVRAIISMIGLDGLDEVRAYVVDEMNAERERLRHFAVETRQEH
jgi:hypothetical protein